MSIDSRLETYLATLDKALGQIPVSDRADIVTEIKSHAMEAMGREPNQDLGAVLTSLGEPETVANRYLLERGLKPVKRSKGPVVKWLTIGFLGTAGICALFCLVVLWKFTPLIKVDEKAGKVVMLGGVIDIDSESMKKEALGKNYKLKLSLEGNGAHLTKGEMSLNANESNSLKVLLSSGAVKLSSSMSNLYSWTCKADQNKGSDMYKPKLKDKQYVVDLTSLNAIECKFDVPKEMLTILEGDNGIVAIDEPLGAVSLKLENGTVDVSYDDSKQYFVEAKVKNGGVDTFESSNDPKAIHLKLDVKNGYISKSN